MTSEELEDARPFVERFYEREMNEAAPRDISIGYKHDAYERITEHWPNPAVRIKDGGPLEDLLFALARALSHADLDIESIYHSAYLDLAEGLSLDLYGEVVNVRRRDGERDPSYRVRVKAGYARALSDTTIEVFGRVLLNVLDTGPENVTLDVKQNEPVVLIQTEEDVLDATPLDREEILDLLNGAVPAGHSVDYEVDGTFRFDGPGYTPPEGTGFGEGTLGG